MLAKKSSKQKQKERPLNSKVADGLSGIIKWQKSKHLGIFFAIFVSFITSLIICHLLLDNISIVRAEKLSESHKRYNYGRGLKMAISVNDLDLNHPSLRYFDAFMIVRQRIGFEYIGSEKVPLGICSDNFFGKEYSHIPSKNYLCPSGNYFFSILGKNPSSDYQIEIQIRKCTPNLNTFRPCIDDYLINQAVESNGPFNARLIMLETHFTQEGVFHHLKEIKALPFSKRFGTYVDIDLKTVVLGVNLQEQKGGLQINLIRTNVLQTSNHVYVKVGFSFNPFHHLQTHQFNKIQFVILWAVLFLVFSWKDPAKLIKSRQVDEVKQQQKWEINKVFEMKSSQSNHNLGHIVQKQLNQISKNRKESYVNINIQRNSDTDSLDNQQNKNGRKQDKKANEWSNLNTKKNYQQMSQLNKQQQNRKLQNRGEIKQQDDLNLQKEECKSQSKQSQLQQSPKYQQKNFQPLPLINHKNSTIDNKPSSLFQNFHKPQGFMSERKIQNNSGSNDFVTALLKIPEHSNEQDKKSKVHSEAQLNLAHDIIYKIINGKNTNPILQKKNYSVLSQILPYSDRREIKVHIELKQIYDNYEKKYGDFKKEKDFSKIVDEWLGMVYRATASVCWNMLSNGLLTFEETKILFTENIIYNFIECMSILKEIGINDEGRTELAERINVTSCHILGFLCTQYPQTKIQDPNIGLRNEINPIDNKGRAKYDLIANVCRSGVVVFRKKEKRDYTSQIMRVINYIIQRANEEWDGFNRQMNELFGEIFIPIQYRNDADYKDKKTHEGEQYYQTVKSYTKYMIGRKISKNTPCYLQPQIQNGIFFVNSSASLRIITKWVEELQETIRDPQVHIKNTQNQFKDHNGMPTHLYAQVKNGLVRQIKRDKINLQSRLQRIRKQCYRMEVLLAMEEYTKDHGQSHLCQKQVQVGRYCSHIKTAIAGYLSSQLNQLIHFLLSVPQKIDEKNLGIEEEYFQGQARKDLDHLNLVTFKIFDLLRCKCISKESEIIYLLKRLNEKHNDPNDEFKLVRIKDRLTQGTRDILINAQIGKGMIFEIQLSVVSTIDKKQQQLDQYNHFLYELKRANLGPIAENAFIWSVLEQRAAYFQKMIKLQPHPIIKRRHACLTNTFIKSQESQFACFPRPIICCGCDGFYAIPRTCLPSVKCEGCYGTFCGECHFESLGELQKKQLVFEKIFLSGLLPHLSQYKDYSQPFPRSGFVVKLLYLKKELMSFKLISKRLEEQEDQNSQNAKQMEIQLVTSVIIGGRIVSKTLNKSRIKAFYRFGEYFIEDKYHQELDTYLIYFLDYKNNPDLEMKILPMKHLVSELGNKKYRFLNLLRQPNYMAELRLVKKEPSIRKQLEDLSNTLGGQERINYIRYNRMIILAQIDIDQRALQADLVKLLNIAKLKALAIDKCTSISMEFRRMSNEMDLLEQRFSPDLFNSFNRRVTKLYLNFGEIKTIGFLKPMTNIKVLFLRDNLLESLEGVQNLVHLQMIRFDKNHIKSLEPLSQLIQLSQIVGTENQIQSMKGIQNLTRLKRLLLYKNDISKIQYTQKLVNLKQLSLNSNSKLRILENIDHLNLLQEFFIADTNISDLSPLASFTALQELSLDNLGLPAVPPFLANFQSLTHLYLSENQIEVMEHFQRMVELVQLSLKSNKIKRIQGLISCPKLEVLKLQNNEITDVRGIRKLQNLRLLNLEVNPLNNVTDLAFMDRKIFKLVFTEKEAEGTIKPTQHFYKQIQYFLNYKGNSSSSSSDYASSKSYLTKLT